MKTRLNKGFTLIELLVVIAIIGILSGIVLTSLNSARAKAQDASIKSNVANLRASAELLYDNNNPNSYDTLCAAAAVTTASAEILKQNGQTGTAGFICNESSDNASYAIAGKLKSGTVDWVCIDSVSGTKTLAAAPAATITSCP